MKCPRCNDVIPDDIALVKGRGDRSVTRHRACLSGHSVTTVERIVYRVAESADGRPQWRTPDRGVRFDIVIGDDEPGARKS